MCSETLDTAIKNYFIKNNIPLVSKVGKSTVSLCCYGYKESGWSAQGQSNWLNKYFPDRPKGCRPYTYILSILNKKYCSSCKKVKELSDFTKNISNNNNLNTFCKICFSVYQKDNPHYWREISARKKNRTPPWADIKTIKEFYKNCPKGYQVDHIIPLNGKLISGLHTIENLQYLTVNENYEKGNKWVRNSIG